MPDRIGIIVNGATGRMTKNQHLINSLLPIQREGGITLANGKRPVPDIMVVDRNAETIQKVAAELKIEKWSTDLDGALADPGYQIYFDGVTTAARATITEPYVNAFRRQSSYSCATSPKAHHSRGILQAAAAGVQLA